MDPRATAEDAPEHAPIFDGLLGQLEAEYFHHACRTWRPWDIAVHFEIQTRGQRLAAMAVKGNPPSTMRTISFSKAQREIDRAARQVMRDAGLVGFDRERAAFIVTHYTGNDHCVLGNLLGPRRPS